MVTISGPRSTKRSTRKRGFDHWIESVAKGIYHIANGWKYRGLGYAKSVSKECWKQFKTEMETARKYLTQAYGLHADYPESSGYMIRIAMVFSNSADQKIWFEKSIESTVSSPNGSILELGKIRFPFVRKGIECFPGFRAE